MRRRAASLGSDGDGQVNIAFPGGTVNAVTGGVLNVYHWKPAYRIEDFPLHARELEAAEVASQPSLPLRAGYQVVPFTGRTDQLQKGLRGW
ncbi:hypothetical protein [Acrocarpospora sp. B8E8]|uniref:hypothetical protein n=1 Tax=Acrocarpospora sp. B8E8 TaxID=3153572 RepID=UPI00325E4B8A